MFCRVQVMNRSLCLRLLMLLTLALLLVVYHLWGRSGERWVCPPDPQPIEKNLFRLISPATYRFVLNQPDKCKRSAPFLVLMVPVHPRDFPARDAVRRTWGQEDLLPKVPVARLFFLGVAAGERDERVQARVEAEGREHGDIVQMDFADTYGNLTVKTMMIMTWLDSFCRGAAYAMKIDADVFLNVDYLVHSLLLPRLSSPDENYITGSVIKDGQPRRNRKSKWFVSEDAYPHDYYPPYVSGAGYLFSLDLALKISWASRFVRPVAMEDVYVGLCLRVLGVKPEYAFSMSQFHNLFEVRHVDYQRCKYSQLVLVNGFKPEQLLRVWHDFQKAKFTC